MSKNHSARICQSQNWIRFRGAGWSPRSVGVAAVVACGIPGVQTDRQNPHGRNQKIMICDLSFSWQSSRFVMLIVDCWLLCWLLIVDCWLLIVDCCCSCSCNSSCYSCCLLFSFFLSLLSLLLLFEVLRRDHGHTYVHMLKAKKKSLSVGFFEHFCR